MKYLATILIWAVLTTAGSAARADEKPIVAVFDMEDRGSNVDKLILGNLTDYLSSRLAEGGYRVVPRDDIRARLKEQKTESYKECYDQSCQIELGRELAAEKTLSSKIMRIADTCQVTAVLYDLKKSATEKAANVEAKCDEASLLAAVKTIASNLTGTGVVKAAAEVEGPPHKWIELELRFCSFGNEFIEGRSVKLASSPAEVHGVPTAERWGGGARAGVRLGDYHLLYLSLDYL